MQTQQQKIDAAFKSLKHSIEVSKVEGDWTPEVESAQMVALSDIQDAGFDWEADEELMRFCQRATDVEAAEATLLHFTRWVETQQRVKVASFRGDKQKVEVTCYFYPQGKHDVTPEPCMQIVTEDGDVCLEQSWAYGDTVGDVDGCLHVFEAFCEDTGPDTYEAFFDDEEPDLDHYCERKVILAERAQQPRVESRWLIDTVLCQHEKTTQIDVDDFVEEGSTTHYMRGYCYPRGKVGCGSDPFVEIVKMIDADPKGEEGEVVAEIDIDCNLSSAKVSERAADVFNAWCDGDGYIEYAERQIDSMVEQYLEDAAMRQLEDRFYG